MSDPHTTEVGRIPDGHERSVCRLGDGDATCAYLTFASGWTCAKAMPEVAATIMGRLAQGTMNAKGDNCSGPPDFSTPVDARQWPMFAGPPTDKGIRLHIDRHPSTVKAYGDEPLPVTLIEDSDGPYLGWIDALSPEDGPQMVQPEFLFSMQFPYGPSAEVERGKGEIVRLRVDGDDGRDE